MNVLVIGSGGREHALAWKLIQSSHCTKVFVAPGNFGSNNEDGIENVDISANDQDGLIAFAHQQGVKLTIVGSEIPLVEGIVDAFNDADLCCFGPVRSAAQLEASKSFAKDFLVRHNIPTAVYKVFTETSPAINYIKEQGIPIVIKADGLASGKGVVVAMTEEQAFGAVDNMLSKHILGKAGHRVVIEEFMTGEEVSFIVMVDGENILPLATSQDHKTRDNGDLGPNTGGMGAYSPASVITKDIFNHIIDKIAKPTVRGMALENRPYTGFLYIGLIIDKNSTPRVVEYNCRLGDPETQPIMMRLKSDLISLCLLALDGKLDQAKIEWDQRAAVGVVLAAGGYPGNHREGDVISGLDEFHDNDTKIFHAGSTLKNGKVVTAGGRVLCVTALGSTVADAQIKAYKSVNKIDWQKMFYRTDIAYRAMDIME
ncbi:MAG: phosphoribosylamine--glycine ligase [Piscirickettsiaceae bacterium]|nr:phosphoribosylamine--glycine ligase [Piscirickettsiaceae bacterium]